MVEHSAVNRRVVGSSPTRGVNKKFAVFSANFLFRENSEDQYSFSVSGKSWATLLSLSLQKWKKYLQNHSVYDIIIYVAEIISVTHNNIQAPWSSG